MNHHIYTNSFGLKPDINLTGTWKFHLRDNLDWRKPAYDDASWDEIFVPSTWEDQGYRNYEGFAWYRRTFVYNGNLTADNPIIMLGRIDDVDQVFINGKFISSTGLDHFIEDKEVHPSDAEWQAFRGYYFPSNLLMKGQNTIAIRVYDKTGNGGIYKGPIGIISQSNYIKFWRTKKNNSR